MEGSVPPSEGPKPEVDAVVPHRRFDDLGRLYVAGVTVEERRVGPVFVALGEDPDLGGGAGDVLPGPDVVVLGDADVRWVAGVPGVVVGLLAVLREIAQVHAGGRPGDHRQLGERAAVAVVREAPLVDDAGAQERNAVDDVMDGVAVRETAWAGVV